MSDANKSQPPTVPSVGWRLVGAMAAVAVLMWVLSDRLDQAAFGPLPYSELNTLLEQDKVQSLRFEQDSVIVTLHEGEPPTRRVTRLPGVDDGPLVERARQRGVKIEGRAPSNFSPWMLLLWLLPTIFIFSMLRRSTGMMGGGGGPLGMGQNRAKLVDESKARRVRFEDVAGVEEAKAELGEVVDFLRHPDKYRALGAHIPKGVLLVGPPGTGKTLMARAVAGESGVAFFVLSGSDFVEMFVGVGAARVRDLFAQAKQKAPCIIFIDELDAIGKSRGGVGAMATHDEREQTLNQLLAEMDGFDPSQGVILMAATNRPEVLDPALLRAGRFDRQVVLDRPDLKGRAAILGVHVKRVPLADDVNLELIARRTPGMSGADLANVVNEAALAATRREGKKVRQRDFEEAIDRQQLGLKKRGRVMQPQEQRRVAFHEAGHALVALSLEHADPVHRVTIIPRSVGALGATLQLPTTDRYLVTQGEIEDKLCVMMGGRAAERLIWGDLSTGAQNDLQQATETARQMVCQLGMSEQLGPQVYGRPLGARFLEGPLGAATERNYSDETAHEIDMQVRALLERAEQHATELLEQRRELLDETVDELLERETLDAADLSRLVERHPARAKVRPVKDQAG